MNTGVWQIPPSTQRWLAEVPADVPVTVPGHLGYGLAAGALNNVLRQAGLLRGQIAKLQN